MANEERKIPFSAQDNGVSSFIKRLQQDTRQLFGEMSKEAEKQSKAQKEQIKLIESQIKALERQNQLEKEQNRLIAERKREAGVLNDKSFGVEMATIKGDSSVNRIQTSILKDMLQTLKENQKEELKPDGPANQRQVFGAVLTAGLLRDVMSLIGQVPGSRSQMDLITPFASMAGGAAGGLAGSIMDASNVKVLGTGLGDTQMGPILANLGKELGAFAGSAVTRSLNQRYELQVSQNAFGALTGNKFGGFGAGKDIYDLNIDGPTFGERVQNAYNNDPTKIRSKSSGMGGFDMTMFGMDYIAAEQMLERIARTTGVGGRGRSQSDALNMAGLGQGFGIDEGTIMGSLALKRQGGSSSMSTIQRSLGIALGEGLSRVGLTDVIKSQTALTAQLASVTTSVNGNQVNRTLFEFNRMGGMFSLMDPRSMQNISGIQQSLANPGSPFGQALNYSVLRKLNPNADAFEIRKMQEQGLNTPGFLQGVMGDITQMGGSETFQKLMLKSRMPNLSFDAVETLFNNRGKLGSMSEGELGKILSGDAISGEAGKYASKLRNDQAEVTNAFTDSFIKGIDTLRTKFQSEMGDAIAYVAQEFKDKMGLGADTKSSSQKVDSKGRMLSQSDKSSQMSVKPLPRGNQTSNYKVDATVAGLEIN